MALNITAAIHQSYVAYPSVKEIMSSDASMQVDAGEWTSFKPWLVGRGSTVQAPPVGVQIRWLRRPPPGGQFLNV